MTLLGTVKNASIAAGLYGPTRQLSRMLRPHQRQAFEDDVQLYRSLIPGDALAFDIGANIGEKSEALLRAGARVVAFEPNPDVLPELYARCQGFSQWNVVQTALGSAADVLSLYSPSSHGSSSLTEGWGGDAVCSRHVPVITLQSAVRRFGMPYYCKIDVEGWELEVLKGLQSAVPLVSLEFHLNDVDIAKTLACLERLRGFGDCSVNLTYAEGSSFHYDDWIKLDEFIDWFPGDLRNVMPGYPYGDLYVLNHAARENWLADKAA